jgi:hypothetical protein
MSWNGVVQVRSNMAKTQRLLFNIVDRKIGLAAGYRRERIAIPRINTSTTRSRRKA